MLAKEPKRPSASISISREFTRSGLFALLTNAEANTYLQVLWNGPIGASKVLGISGAAAKRALRRLKKGNLVTKTPAGYVAAHDFSASEDFLWVEPLKYGWLSLPARLLLIFLSEWCRGRRHCFRKGMAEAMETSLGIRKRRYDELFAELVAAGMVGKKRFGRFWSIAYALPEIRKELRRRDKYLKRPKKLHLLIPIDAITGVSGSATLGCQEVQLPGSGGAVDGIRECNQGSSSGSASGNLYGTHSQKKKSEDLDLVPGSRAETFLKVFMESKNIDSKYTPAIQKRMKEANTESTLDGLLLCEWVLFLYLLRRDTTVRFTLFFETSKNQTLAADAKQFIRDSRHSDPSPVEDALESSVRENSEWISEAMGEEALKEFWFEHERPRDDAIEFHVKKFYYCPTENITTPHLKEFHTPYPLDTWTPPDKAPLAKYAQKWKCEARVQELMSRFEAEVSSPKYQENLRRLRAEKAVAIADAKEYLRRREEASRK